MDEAKKESAAEALRRAIEAIAAEGKDAARRVSDAVEAAIRESAGARDAFARVVRETAEGAARGLERVKASERGRTLAAILDGLGDGLARAGQGAKLAVEEAAARGKAFAGEDVERLRREFESVRKDAADSIVRSFDRASREVKDSLGDVRMHAERTIEAARPSIEAALDALRKDPAGAAFGAAAAGASAGREALGSLFGALGRWLEKTGDRMRG